MLGLLLQCVPTGKNVIRETFWFFASQMDIEGDQWPNDHTEKIVDTGEI